MCPEQTDADASRVATMDREALTRAILTIECEFPVDLTEEILVHMSLEKLRHVYLALLRHAKQSGRRAD